jgi:hypothetical protein
MSMIEITADVEAIIKQAILSFVATVNEDGTPKGNFDTCVSEGERMVDSITRLCTYFVRIAQL